MTETDVIVIGAGMAGASAAYELAARCRVLVLERESQPGYHSTGRSMAIYTESYGNAQIRAITTGAKPFFAAPPPDFSEVPLWHRRGLLLIGREDQVQALETLHAEVRRLAPEVALVDGTAACARVPVLRADYVAVALREDSAMELDVDAILQGYLRGMRRRGAEVITGAEVQTMAWGDGGWTVHTPAGTFLAPVVVNAAGAWADQVAQAAGTRPVGLVPMRRTVAHFSDARADGAWPMIVDVDEEFYFKAEPGRILCSPADETPVPPSDIQPEEEDIAVAIDRLQKATTFRVHAIDGKWAGLRTFAPDKTPVVGYDPDVDGFFWLAGQGGYGIQTAPAMARIADSLLAGGGLPEDLAAIGVAAEALAPGRFAVP